MPSPLRVAPALRCVAAASLALLAATVAAAAETPATEKVTQLDVVDRSIALHGGPVVAASRVRLTVSSKSGSFDIVTERRGDTFDHRIIEGEGADGRTHRQTNTSLEITEGGATQPVAADDRRRAESYVNQRMYFLFLPYKLNDPGTYKEDLGLETWDGRELRKVRVSFQPGTSAGDESQYMYWFDPETSRLEQFAYDYSGGTGLRFRKLFNYREVGGIVFYDAENYGLNTNRGGLGVDLVTPDYAADLPLVSTIELSNIEVEALD